MKLELFRLSHRPKRDKRVTTHLFLAARALGCTSAYYSGERDIKLEPTIKDVVERWGGNFTLKYIRQWKTFIKNYTGTKVHLTMYGLQVHKTIQEIKKTNKPILIIVGSEKIPPQVFELADYNISITNQPHSEISAISLFLRELLGPSCYEIEFNGKLKIIPSNRKKINS